MNTPQDFPLRCLQFQEIAHDVRALCMLPEFREAALRDAYLDDLMPLVSAHTPDALWAAFADLLYAYAADLIDERNRKIKSAIELRSWGRDPSVVPEVGEREAIDALLHQYGYVGERGAE